MDPTRALSVDPIAAMAVVVADHIDFLRAQQDGLQECLDQRIGDPRDFQLNIITVWAQLHSLYRAVRKMGALNVISFPQDLLDIFAEREAQELREVA